MAVQITAKLLWSISKAGRLRVESDMRATGHRNQTFQISVRKKFGQAGYQRWMKISCGTKTDTAGMVRRTKSLPRRRTSVITSSPQQLKITIFIDFNQLSL
jgi:hypothetical protein